MPQGLILKIGADVTEATAAIKQVVTEAKAGGKSVEKSFGKTTLPVTKGIKEAGETVKRVTPQFTVLGKSIETLRAQALARKSLITTLLPDTDFVKIRQYNIEIKQLEAEIKRIQSLGTGGIAQSLGSVGTGASRAFSALRQAAFVLPGIGIAGLLGGLGDLVIGLFKSSDAFTDTELAAARFAIQIKNASQEIDRFVSGLQFTSELEKLNARLNLGPGFGFDVASIDIDTAINDKIIQGTNGIVAELNRQADRLKENIGQFGSDAGKQLKEAFAPIDIPDDLLKDLPKFDKEIFQQLKANAELVVQAEKEREKAIDDNSKLAIKKSIERRDESAKILKQRKEDYERFVNDTISKAKELSSFLEKRGVLDIGAGFNIDPRKSKLENFEQAKQFISNAVSSKFGFLQVRTPLSIEFAQATIKTLDIQGIKFQILPTTDAEKLRKELEDSIKGMTPSIALQIKQIDTDAAATLAKIEKNAQATANIINGALTPAFDNLFNAIQAGENPLKAFFQGIGQAVLDLIKKLIQAAITAAILSAIIPGGAGTAGGFGKIFGKLFGFSGGGLVTGPTLGMIGEGSGTSLSNPEVIAPLDQLKSMLSDLNIGSQRVQVAITGRLRGRDMALQNARTSRSNRRLGA